MKIWKAYSVIATAILCASCGLPRDATKIQRQPWSLEMIHTWLIPPELQIDERTFDVDQTKFQEWLKQQPTTNASNCMPLITRSYDPSGAFQTQEHEPFGFNSILRPNQHTDAFCWQDGPILDIFLLGEPGPVYLYRQWIYHFHVVDDTKNGTPCSKIDPQLDPPRQECDMDLIRVCRDKASMAIRVLETTLPGKTPNFDAPVFDGYATPCTMGQPGGKNTTGLNGCNICVMKHYAETPG